MLPERVTAEHLHHHLRPAGINVFLTDEFKNIDQIFEDYYEEIASRVIYNH